MFILYLSSTNCLEGELKKFMETNKVQCQHHNLPKEFEMNITLLAIIFGACPGQFLHRHV